MNEAGGTVDVVVVGAGIAGASAAWALAEHLDVVLVEREPAAGYHATGRSASVLSATSGPYEVCALAAASRPFFEAPPEGFGEVALLAPRGLWWVGQAADSVTLDRFAVEAAAVTSVRRMTAAETLVRLPGFRHDAVAGGSVAEPEAMAIDTAALLDGYLRGLRRRGARLLTTAEAIRATPTGAGWTVTVGGSAVRCRHVVNAAGAWADEFAARAGVDPLGLQPHRRTAALVPAPATVAGWPLVMDIAGRYYVEPESGGLLLSPADETPAEPGDARPEETDVAWALHRLDEATELGVQRVLRSWAGLRTFAPDRRPVVGEDPRARGFWWLAGQGGAGIKTAPALAALLAAQLLGVARPPTPVDEARLGPARLRTPSAAPG